MFLISGCTNGENRSKIPEHSPEQQEQIKDVLKHKKKEKQSVALTYKPVTNTQKIRKVSQINSKEIVQELQTSVGKIMIYNKKDDDKNHYGAFVNQNKTYDLGVVSGRHPDNINIHELKLYNNSLVRIDGVFGANAPVQNYFEIEDGKIKPFLKVTTGHVKEVDLEGDGKSEIVSLHGSPMLAHIYKWDNGAFKVANINEALGALHVSHTEENLFRVLFNGSKELVMYQYKTPGVLELKNKGADSQNSNENKASIQPHKEVTDITQLPDRVDLSFTPLELEGLERGEKLKSWEPLKSISLGSIKGKSITLHVFDETNQDNLCSASYETVSLVEFNGNTYKLPDCTSASLKEKKLKQALFTSKDLKQKNHEQIIVAGVELAANGPGRMLYMVYDSSGQNLWSFEDWGLLKVVDLDHSGEKEFINQFQGLHMQFPDVTIYRWENGTIYKSLSWKKVLSINNHNQNTVSLVTKSNQYIFDVRILTDYQSRTYQNVKYRYENGELQKIGG